MTGGSPAPKPYGEPQMSRSLTVAGVFSCLLVASLAGMAAESANPPVYVSAADVRARVAQTKDGLVSSPLPTGVGGAVLLMVRRDAPGEVEVHDALGDVLVAQEGKASVLVGGQVQGNRQTAPGEWRGGKITGAKTYDFAVGDILWIPAGIPHQVVVAQGASFTYLAFKSPKS
jgi:hypothetical protein